MKWPMVALGEISLGGGEYGLSVPSCEWWEGAPRYIRITDIDDSGALKPTWVAPQDGDHDHALLSPGDLLFARSGATVGKTYLHTAEFEGPAVYAGYLIRFRPNPEIVFPEYLFRFTQSRQYLSWVKGSQRTVAQPNINAAQYAALRVPLPPLDEQRRIAAILDTADALRAKLGRSLVIRTALIQSVFDGMFWDSSHETVRFGDVVKSFRNGLSPSTSGQVHAPVLTLSAVTRGYFDSTATKDGQFNGHPRSSVRVSARDFLICRGNGNRALVGVGVHPTIDRPDLVFPDTVIAATVDLDRVDLSFLETVWKQRSVRRQVESVARTTNGTFKINQQGLATIEIGLPPLEAQREFATRVSMIDQTRALSHDAAAAMEELFASLQARAFAGEL